MPCTPRARLRPVGPVRTFESLSFRNDHDAAISRIAALERELAGERDAAQQKSDRDSRRIAMLEREIADLRRHEPSAPRRARAPSTPPAPAAPVDELDTRGPPIQLAALGWLLFVVLSILAISSILMVYDLTR
jgi:hypothetical protein